MTRHTGARRFLAGTMAGILAACGSADRGVDTVLLVTVDDLRADHLAPYGYRHPTSDSLQRLAREGLVFEDAVTPSTGRTSALASLMSGRLPWEHGLTSIGEIGRHRLAARFETLAEVYDAAGFTTLAAVPMRQLEGRLSGLSQGFSVVLEAGLPESGAALTGEDLLRVAQPELDRALSAGNKVFAWVHFADLASGVGGLAPHEEDTLRKRLKPYAEHPVIKRELDHSGAKDPLLARLERAIGRRRGNDMWRDLRDAEYDIQLARLEAALGPLFDTLRQNGRYANAVIAVVGTRGRYLTEERPDGAAEGFSEGVIRVPLLLKGPEREIHWKPGDTWGDAFSSKSLYYLLLRYAGDTSVYEPYDDPPIVLSDEEWSFCVADNDWKSVWECQRGRRPIWIERASDRETEEPLAVVGRSQIKNGRNLFPTLEVQLAFLAAEPHEWSFSVRTKDPDLVGFATAGMTEGVQLRGSGRELFARWRGSGGERQRTEVTTAGPAPPLLLSVSVDGRRPPERALVLADGTPVLNHPVPRMPAADGAEWKVGGARPWLVDIAREDGWLEVSVPEEAGQLTGDVSLHVAAFPPGEDPFVFEASGSVRRVSDEALPGAILLEGPLPFTARLRQRPRAQLAFFVRIGEAAVPVDRIRYLGRRFAKDELTLYFPPWLPERLDWFAMEVRDSAPRSQPPPPGEGQWASIRFERKPGAFRTEGPIGLNADDVLFLTGMASRQ